MDKTDAPIFRSDTESPYFTEDQKARMDELNRIARGDPKPPTTDEVAVDWPYLTMTYKGDIAIERLEIAGDYLEITGSLNGKRFRTKVGIIVKDGRIPVDTPSGMLVFGRAGAQAVVEEWNRTRP